ncbi:MAG: nucleotidyltransferase [Lentisphaeria bacterium]|nr:nucleotidyltransferase [Lentisphaeria bacterium]
MVKPALLVLAAGMGSRYGGLKQIDPVGPSGEIILDYSIYDALQCGFEKVVFVIRRDIEAVFRETVGSKWERKVQVEYVFQDLNDLPAPYRLPAGRTKPWGTGHAILSAADKIREPFAAINADDFYGRSAYSLLAKAFASNPDPVKRHFMVGFTLRNTLSENGTVSRGICVKDADDLLTEVTERTDILPVAGGKAQFKDTDGSVHPLTGDEIASMNFWGFMPSIFDHLGGLFEDFLSKRGTEMKSEFYIPFAVSELIGRGIISVRVMNSTDPWFGVTYREDKPVVQQSIRGLVERGIYPTPLEK